MPVSLELFIWIDDDIDDDGGGGGGGGGGGLIFVLFTVADEDKGGGGGAVNGIDTGNETLRDGGGGGGGGGGIEEIWLLFFFVDIDIVLGIGGGRWFGRDEIEDDVLICAVFGESDTDLEDVLFFDEDISNKWEVGTEDVCVVKGFFAKDDCIFFELLLFSTGIAPVFTPPSLCLNFGTPSWNNSGNFCIPEDCFKWFDGSDEPDVVDAYLFDISWEITFSSKKIKHIIKNKAFYL